MTSYDNVTLGLLQELRLMNQGFGYLVLRGVNLEVQRVDAEHYLIGAMDYGHGPMTLVQVRQSQLTLKGEYIVILRDLVTDTYVQTDFLPTLEQALTQGLDLAVRFVGKIRGAAMNQLDAFAV